ncbi:MAG: DUF2079 domain-containing protein [Chloroflexota bacterium]|nr:DUF2079 domain-containing protein [Chloroflexota bacterium]
MFKHFDAQHQKQLALFLLILLMLIYGIGMSIEVVLRYETFKATAFDLGNMDQVLWNTIHGHLFQFTNQAIDWYGPPTRLAFHFEPILLPLSLLYLFGADPRIILVFQTLALTSGALPVFLLARKYLREWPLLAVLMVGIYLFSPALIGLNLFDFHPFSLTAPLFLYAMLALVHKRYGWLLFACVLAASCKEDAPLGVAMFGLMMLWKFKLPRLGLTLIIGGFLWSFIAFKFIMPHFYPGVLANNFWYRYESLGSSPGIALANIALHPWLIFTTFITLDRLYYLASLFRSVGFICLLAPEWLIPALPDLAANTLSTDPLTYTGVYHYNATIIPFIMISAIFGMRRLLNLWMRWRGEAVEPFQYASWITSPATPEGEHSNHSNLSNPIRQRFAVVFTSLQSIGRKMLEQGLLWLRQWRFYRTLARTMQLYALSFKKWAVLEWQRFSKRMIPLAKRISLKQLQLSFAVWILLMLILNFVVTASSLNAFWADHLPGSREQYIQQLLAMIPPHASVSAGDNLNPHLSDRQRLAIFPSITDSVHNDTVDYIIIDLYAVFPDDRSRTTDMLNQLEHSGEFKVLRRAQGVVLLIRRSG